MQSVSVQFVPKSQTVEVTPLRLAEYFMPWRWSRLRRTVTTFTDIELLWISIVDEPPVPAARLKR